MFKKKTAIIAGITVTLAIAFGLGWWFNRHQNPPQTNEPLQLSGHITALSEGCNTKGTCSITLDHTTTVITSCAVLPGDAQCRDYDPAKLRIGGELEATAVKAETGNYYNLECDTCTIKAK